MRMMVICMDMSKFTELYIKIVYYVVCILIKMSLKGQISSDYSVMSLIFSEALILYTKLWLLIKKII